MRRLGGTILLGLMAAAFGCASPEVDDQARYREQTLLEDNESLQKQLADLRSVEAALNRELETKNREIESLRKSREQLQRELEQVRRARPAAAEVPASLRDTKRTSIDAAAFRTQGVEVVTNDDGTVTLRIASDVMFEPGKAEPTKEGKRILDRVGDALKRHRDLLISVEGHTDSTPLVKTKAIWGTNLALSLARAMSVQDYLKREKGIADARMRVVGYGPHRPLVEGKTPEALARNRRVELVLDRR